MKSERRFFPGCMIALFLLAAGGYLLICLTGSGFMGKQKNTTHPGTLTGISYHYSSGMSRGSDFSITLSPEAVVETTYWPSPDADPVTKKNIPIAEERWREAEQIVLELYPEMKPRREKGWGDKILSLLTGPLDVRDGGDSTGLTLTWSTEDGSRSIRYNRPNDRRFQTLIALLDELAHLAE